MKEEIQMNGNKLNDQELSKVAGGAAMRVTEYQIIEIKTGRMVVSVTSLDEANEILGDYGEGYKLVVVNR